MSAAGIALRLAVFLALIVGATWITHEIRESLDIMVMPRNEQAVHNTLMMGIGFYIVLLSLPFIPGAEIGLTMLTVFGAPIAPLVYGATVAALLLSYTVGRCVPSHAIVRALHAVRLARAAEAVERIAPLGPEARVAAMMQGSTPRALRFAARYRYLALILAINTPGNIVVGGGGGIALMAGISRVFAPVPYALAVAIAVSPVPLAITLMGR